MSKNPLFSNSYPVILSTLQHCRNSIVILYYWLINLILANGTDDTLPGHLLSLRLIPMQRTGLTSFRFAHI